MRIGIYDPYLDVLGGGERYMLTAAKCLSQNHTVELFWYNADIIKKAQERFGLDLSSVKVTKNIFTSQYGFLERFKITRSYDAIVYLSDGSLPFLFSKKSFIHFQFPVEWVRTNPLTALKIRMLTNIITNSAYTKKFIDKKFTIDSVVLYPPFQPIKKNSAMKKNSILTVGRFNRLPHGGNFKKLDVMITAFKQLVDEGLKDWEFVVVTNSDEKGIQELQEMVNNYPIKVENGIENSRLQEYYSAAKLYWHAAGLDEDLNKHPERAEHFGISPLEAMSSGAVPIVFRGGGLPEIVQDKENGYLFRTVDELKAATKIVATDTKIWEKLSKAAEKRSMEFGGERFCRELHTIIGL